MTVKTVAEFIKDADSEIERGDWKGAWKIATEGLQYYPEDALLKKYAYVLAPSKVTTVNAGGHPEVRANREWMQKHRQQYRGHWVALKNGQLLAFGKDHDDVIEQVGDIKNKDILVTPIY